MSVPPGHDDDGRDDSDAKSKRQADPDRAAILARRQRFIALALTGLTAAACDKPNDDPNAPRGKSGQEGKADGQAQPQPCLDVQPPVDGDVDEPRTDVGMPVPCLEVAPEPYPDDDDVAPQACLKVVKPPDDPKPPPQPCLRVVKPPDPEPEPAPPQPCLKVAKPR